MKIDPQEMQFEQLTRESAEKEKRIRKLEQTLRDFEMKLRQLDARIKRTEARSITRRR
jgi:septal ring factor EnvC (AmiA/AmiB activator)